MAQTIPAATIIGAWLRRLREQKGLSQADIEKTTGLLRGYISRVENGRTVPSLETLERMAAALQVPLYQLFYMDRQPDSIADWSAPRHFKGTANEVRITDRYLLRLRELCGRMRQPERDLLLGVAKRMATRHRPFRA